MALRIGTDTDFFNAGFTQAAPLNNGEGIGECAGYVDVSADQKQPPHIGFATKAGQQFLQQAGTGNPACRDVSDRLKTGLAQARGRRNELMPVLSRHRSQIKRRIARKNTGKRRNFCGTRTGRLERKSSREAGKIGRSTGGGRYGHDYSRRREITKDSS
jgi:hypothetical protein